MEAIKNYLEILIDLTLTFLIGLCGILGAILYGGSLIATLFLPSLFAMLYSWWLLLLYIITIPLLVYMILILNNGKKIWSHENVEYLEKLMYNERSLLHHINNNLILKQKINILDDITKIDNEKIKGNI